MIVQYCVDYEDFVFGEITGLCDECPVTEPKLLRELIALRKMIFLEQSASIVYACTPNLLAELTVRKTDDEHRRIYGIFKKSFDESGWTEAYPTTESSVALVETSLLPLSLRDSTDRHHLAEAIALQASWFLTNDSEILSKCRGKNIPISVRRPSESIDDIFLGL